MNEQLRKAKLEKALAFDGTILPHKHFPMLVIGEGEQFALVNEYTKHGMKLASLAPLHAALIEAIENLEDIQAWCRDRDASNAIVYAVYLSRSTEALAKLDKALEGMGGE